MQTYFFHRMLFSFKGSVQLFVKSASRKILYWSRRTLGIQSDWLPGIYITNAEKQAKEVTINWVEYYSTE